MRGLTVLVVTLWIVVASVAYTAEPTLTLTMRLAEAEWQVVRQDLLPPFEAACHCRVRAIDVPPEALVQRLRAMRRAGRMQIDVFAQDNMRLQELVDAALVTPLRAEESQVDEAVYPALMQAGVIGDVRYFLPFRPNVQIAYYNAKKFQQYGLQPPRTWPQLLHVAKTFHAKEGVGRVLFKGAGGAPTTTQLYEWIVSAGGDPFDLAHPGTVQTFRFLATLRPYLSPDSRRAKWDTTNDALAQESAYLAQNWPFGVPLLIREYGKTEIRTYSGWAGPTREAHVIGGDVLGIPVGASHRELALALIRHLQSRKVQTVLVSKLGWPSLRADAIGTVAPWMQPHAAAIGDALRHGVFRTNVSHWAEYERIVNEAVQRILWRREAPDRVLPPLAARLHTLREHR
ncbi:MAG: extracellular solute-binding protein [Candidatus Tectomicrobia bacterium]